jgi:hypothetical protein
LRRFGWMSAVACSTTEAADILLASAGLGPEGLASRKSRRRARFMA